MGSQFLSLSLFIVLLSFFVVLNGLSSYEETRVNAVLSSVHDAFSTDYVLKTPVFRASPQPREHALDTGEILEQIEALFRDKIPDMQVRRMMFGQRMELAMPQSVFEAVLNGADKGGKEFAVMLAKLTGTGAQQFELQVMMHEASKLQLRKAGGYAAMLEAFALPSHLFSVGVQKGKAGWVTLVFIRHVTVPLTSVPDGGRV